MKILLVEDDPELQGALDRRLRASGFAVDAVGDMPEARSALEINTYSCLVLDRAVPSGDTIDLVANLRYEGVTTPVLFLTAKDAVSDRVAGFEAGGDDYLVKPFAVEELVARVRSLTRRAPSAAPTVLTIGDLDFNQARAEVRRGGILLPMTAKELCVLGVLAVDSGTVVTRTELIEQCWDELTDPMSNTVEVHVASLRRKLGDPPLIHTVRGVGYVLEP